MAGAKDQSAPTGSDRMPTAGGLGFSFWSPRPGIWRLSAPGLRPAVRQAGKKIHSGTLESGENIHSGTLESLAYRRIRL